MAGEGADALQVPPAIPAVDREDPEGVSGESAAAATAAANLAALARQGADDMASEAGGRVGAAAAAPGGGAARVPAMTTPARGGEEGGSGRPPPDQRAVMMRNDDELRELEGLMHEEGLVKSVVEAVADEMGNIPPFAAVVQLGRLMGQLPRLMDGGLVETEINRMRTTNLASFDEMLRTAEPNELMNAIEVAVQVDLLYRRYTVVEPGPVSPRITDLLVNDHTFIEWSLSKFFKPYVAKCELEAFKRFGKPTPAAGGGGVGGFGGGNGQSALVVKAKGKTVMNKFPKLVAIKKDNSNATEHYSYLFELFVALRANLARPKGSLDEAALVTAAGANEHVSQSWARFGLENSEDEDVEAPMTGRAPAAYDMR